MAIGFGYGPAANVTVRPMAGFSVWGKLAWSDEWTYLPDLDPVSCVQHAGGRTDEATLRSRYGRALVPFEPYFRDHLPIGFNDIYIAIDMHTPWGDAGLWVGSMQVNELAFPEKEQTYHCYGLEHMLDRIEHKIGYTESGPIDRKVVFNRREGRGLGMVGNRSDALDEDGAHNFAADGELWSNQDILNYLIVRFLNQMGDIQFYLDPLVLGIGASGMLATNEVLAGIYEEHDLWGKTVKQCIDALIPRNRGLSWYLWTTGAPGAPMYIVPYSLTQNNIWVGDFVLPGNPIWYDYLLNRDDVRIREQHTMLHTYDAVVVRGGPLSTCATLSYSTGNIVKGWTADEQGNYIEAGGGDIEEADKERATDKYRNVFQKFRVPDNWNGLDYNGVDCFPEVTALGGVDLETRATFWRHGLKFERQLPIIEGADPETNQVEYRRPFVLLYDDEESNGWVYPEKLAALERTPMQLTLSDRDMAFWLEPAGANHVLALNWFMGDSNVDPEQDFSTLVGTFFFRTDRVLFAQANVPGRVVVDLPRIKYIDVPDAEGWYIVPGTVIDVQDGELVTTTIDDAFPRWDGDYLQAIAALAAGWYAEQSATCQLEIEGALGEDLRGGMLRFLGPITTKSIRWHGSKLPTTSVSTGYAELQFQEIVKP